jgi:hypothetical protein
MPNKLTIPKQDTRPPQTLPLELPAHVAERLQRFAADGGHSPSYVAAFILDGALPPEEVATAKKVETPKEKHSKETPSKAA